MPRLKVFICYSRKNGSAAGDFGRILRNYFGYEVFLAHDDLLPSDNFPREILKNLKTADYVIPFLSIDFLPSSYANQEVGLSLAYGKKIIPVSIDGTDPCGFIDKTQAHKCLDQSEHELLRAAAIIYYLPIQHSKYKSYQARNVESLIYAFENSPRWDITSAIIDAMIESGKHIRFSSDQITRITDAYHNNYQIHGADLVMPKLFVFLKDKYGVTLTAK